jgi:isopenicillin-N epimerase
VRDAFALDPSVVFLNHGSFGACPKSVLAKQAHLRAQLESEPVRFFEREYEPLLDEALATLGTFLGARPSDLAAVTNTTQAVNSVLRSLVLKPGDEVLTTTHAYNACRQALEAVATRSGAKVIVAPVPFPLTGAADHDDAVLSCVTNNTRLALLDHVTSPTALCFDLARLVGELESRGVLVLVDGAHAPGMVELRLEGLGASFYAGNLHKWVCAPKGAAFLYVRPDRQALVRPLAISHGANSPRVDRSRFRLEYDWVGTIDPTLRPSPN